MTAFPREKSSPYYPPRARWYGPVFKALAGVRRKLALDRLNPRLAADVSLLGLIGSFVLPALGFYLRLPRLLGLALIAWASFLALAFFVFLGQWEDNFIFGMLLSVHVSGFVFYCTPLLGPSIPRRLGFTLVMLVAIRLLVYSPIQICVAYYIATPLQFEGRMTIVSPVYATKSVRRGDIIAYDISGTFVGEESRYGLAPVLALPGEKIVFGPNIYSVDGVPHPRMRLMPDSGNCVVPEKEWFVWPNIDIHENLYGGESRMSEYLMQMALVSEGQLVGKPVKRWFWWTQQSK